MRLTWIIVSYQSEQDLRRFLPSLRPALAGLERAGLPCDLLVIDNASPDESARVAQELVPDACVLLNRVNSGYGAALNHAARRARGTWLALSNADLIIPPGGLEALPGVLREASPEVALVGPELRGEDGRLQLSAGLAPTLGVLLRGLFRPNPHRKYLPAGAHVRGPVDWLTGACLFARRDAFLASGGFDEGFFLYYEDADLGARLGASGRVSLYEPSLTVVHRRPHYGRALSPDIQACVRAGRRRYFAKHRPAWERAVLAALAAVEPIVRREAAPPRTNGEVNASRPSPRPMPVRVLVVPPPGGTRPGRLPARVASPVTWAATGTEP